MSKSLDCLSPLLAHFVEGCAALMGDYLTGSFVGRLKCVDSIFLFFHEVVQWNLLQRRTAVSSLHCRFVFSWKRTPFKSSTESVSSYVACSFSIDVGASSLAMI